ncbi:DUF2490 domain-containing protein [Frigoriflavimonas asaccharolytica]|uniref:DUF2490 domain-containing protein n=1 Tax=Frigoriflavimonas asaccharolytica TaxID=2735899 RepID=A0A8J8G718_9FLAO|nr:DUF2490 domain-containing protein [Frigoriflavimonas asaccharolytica]NRS92181.1 hypothetical protein [Frigoriflavimonas asaccharolytica]
MKKITTLLLLFAISIKAYSQNTKQDDVGAWYMYFYSTKFKDSRFGIQGDVQYRNFNLGGDLEQLLLRSGITYNPKDTNVTLTLGIANITSGVLGENNDTSSETRIYQEALLPQKVGERFYFSHRFRYEQRFVENQDFRTRFRYNLFLNVPLNKKALMKDAVYIALYNELFINGEKNIGNNKTVGVFDRNRFYAGLGYGITDKVRVQVGFMNQSTENNGKDQLQLSLHHSF